MDAKNSLPKQYIKGKFDWPGDDVLKQYFSLPSNIIYYMVMNPSTPKCYNKLIQCCKHFFERNPIIVVKNLIFYDCDEPFESQTKICPLRECECQHFGCCVHIDIYKFINKFWLTSELEFDFSTTSEFGPGFSSNNNPNYISTLCSKIFQCDIVKLELEEKVIYYEDFKLLALSAKEILLDDVEVIYNKEDDDDNVMLEKILEACPKVKKFTYVFGGRVYTSTSETIKNIEKLKDFEQNIFCFVCYRIPEIFKVEDLSNFIKNHEFVSIQLHFDSGISNEYENQLDALIDTQ
uniref:Uncharacterized protein n=1 Tax=Panagrolaimus davidi TaxID=227884 RepID=A0A914Q710_9BILA